MEGKSHKVGGALVGISGFYALQSHGFLIDGVSPLIQFVIIYPFAIVGSLLPDQDHHESSVPLKEPVALVFCKLLHLTHNLRKRLLKLGMSERNIWYQLLGIFDAEHRSWQTHSDLSFAITVFAIVSTFNSFGGGTTVNGVIFLLIAIGLFLGVLSHLFLDMLTPSGVWCVTFVVINRLLKRRILPEKIRFVPNTSFFATGGTWEMIWRKSMAIVAMLMFLYLLLEQSPWEINIYL